MPPLHKRAYSTLQLALHGQTLVITLVRPFSSNALDTVMTRELLGIWQQLAADSSPYRVIILTGSGDKCFCAGADLKERNGLTTDTWLEQHAVLEHMMVAMHTCPLPVIAAVNGAAFGGGLELVLNCDFAYGCPQARFAFPEPKLGFIPGAMGTQWLPRAVGLARARELCMTGEVFNADQALLWGLLNQVHPQADLMARVLECASRIQALSPLAIRQVKKALNATLSHDLIGGYEQEIAFYNTCIEGPDRHEGIRAFNEKRAPDFGNAASE